MNIEEPKRIALPTKFGMKSVNAWLFLEPEPTLIDCGEKTEKSYEYLVKELKTHGIKIADLKKLIITHAHVDHMGMASRLQAESNCEVLVNEYSLPWAIDFDKMKKIRRVLIEKHLKENFGPKSDFVSAILQYFETIGTYWENLNADYVKTYDWGQYLQLGNARWKTIYTPGHCTTQAIFHDETNQRLISSDMLLNITPTVVIDHHLDDYTKVNNGIFDLLESFELVKKLDFKRAFPGHYNIIENGYELIDYQVNRIHQRVAECLELIKSGKNRFSEILNGLYPDNVSFPAIVMLVAYLQKLEIEKKISKNLHDDYWFFEP